MTLRLISALAMLAKLFLKRHVNSYNLYPPQLIVYPAFLQQKLPANHAPESGYLLQQQCTCIGGQVSDSQATGQTSMQHSNKM